MRRSLDEVLLGGHAQGVQSVTIREAKARLNALVEAAERGEQVVLMRGAHHVAMIVPLSADDIEVSPRLGDAQAERFWSRLASERRHGAGVVLESPEEAVAVLLQPAPKAGRPSGAAPTRARRRKR